MKGRVDSEQEGPERDRQGGVQRCRTRRVGQPKALVSNVTRVDRRAGRPCRKPPDETHLIGPSLPGQHSEHEADGEVHDAQENYRGYP